MGRLRIAVAKLGSGAGRGDAREREKAWTFLAVRGRRRALRRSGAPLIYPPRRSVRGNCVSSASFETGHRGPDRAGRQLSVGTGRAFPRPGRFGASRSRETVRNGTMAKVIGIDLGTTNSCVAVMEGRDAQGHREFRGRAHHALDRRFHRRRRAAGRPAGQAPGRHQPRAHVLRDQAPDRPALRRPDDQEGHGPRSLQDHQGRPTATPGSPPTASNIRPRRFPPSSCRR